MENCSEGRRGPEQQTDLPRQPPQSSRMVHFGMQKVTGEWQKAGVNGQAAPASAQMLKCKDQSRKKLQERIWRLSAEAEELKQVKDTKKKQELLLQISKGKKMSNISLASTQLCMGPSS